MNCILRRFFLFVFFLLPFAFSFAQQTDSLDFKIGQMLMIGIPGPRVDSAVLEEVRRGKVGSIILFELNIPKANSYAGLKKIVYSYQKAAPLPLLIGIDQEGGKVNRLKEKYGFPKSITARAMGKEKSLDSVRFYAQSTAATLAGLGFNINFAPVVDVAVNPENTVIVKYERAFSSDPDSVTRMAKEYIRAHRKVGVITVMKHFPGHGSSKADTHLGVADVTATWTAKELIPYKQLIDSGYTDAIMTAHIVNRVLDQKAYPGTLSSRVIDSLLRKTLGYQGVVFSDDMQMFAIAKQYGLEEGIRLAITAGCDVLCFSNNIQGSEARTVDKVLTIIRNLVISGAIKKERIDESYRRILKLKSTLASGPGDVLRKSLRASSSEIERLKAENESLKKELTQNDPKSKKKKKNKKKK